jgi:hypothetical protein
MPNVNEMVEQHWPDHVPHAEKYGPHSVDNQAGVLCGCGELLGWPIEDEPEGYDEPEPDPYALPRPESARGQEAYDKIAIPLRAARLKATKRTDDYAAEPKVRQGAFGTYPEVGGAGVPAEPVTAPEEPLDAEVVDDTASTGPAYFSPVVASRGESGWVAGPPGGSGLAEVEREVFAEKATADRGSIEFKPPEPNEIPMAVHADGMVGDQTVEEWRAAQVAAGHGPNPEVLADLGLAADGPVTDEAQTYEVGETVTVGGIEFTKKAEHPSIYTKPEPSTITEAEAAKVMASAEGQVWANEGGTEPYTTTEAEAAKITAGIEESVRAAAELAEFGHCDAGAYEGFDVCWEPAVTDKHRRFCRDHWFVGTEQCDAFVPDGHESADQCQGRTEFEAAENMLCEDHAEWTGTGVSGNVYVNGRVDGDDWHASLERSRCTFVFEHKPCVFQVLHTVDYHHLSDGRDVHPDGTVDAAIPTTDAPAVVAEVAEPEQETGLTPGSGTPIMPTSPDSMDPVGSYYPPIDPTQVYTPQDIEIAIVEILRRLGNGEAFLREQIARLHQADYAYTMRYNLKIATSKARAADQRKAEAILACKNEIYEQTEADMLVRALRDTMHNLRSQLAGFQTVARSVGVSMGAPNFRP